MSIDWLARQLAAASVSGPTPRDIAAGRRGVIWVGSATDAVLLSMQPGHWYTHAQLIARSQRTTKAVCWALMYLRSLKLIRASDSDARNPRYRRYQITEAGAAVAAVPLQPDDKFRRP